MLHHAICLSHRPKVLTGHFWMSLYLRGTVLCTKTPAFMSYLAAGESLAEDNNGFWMFLAPNIEAFEGFNLKCCHHCHHPILGLVTPPRS